MLLPQQVVNNSFFGNTETQETTGKGGNPHHMAFVSTAKQQDIGGKTAHRSISQINRIQAPAPPINDKYDYSGLDYWQNSNKSEKTFFVLEQQIYLRNLDNLQYFKMVFIITFCKSLLVNNNI